MNFLLKIVRGPNAGAEIALVEGLPISVGKSDDCDIVLADPTLPEGSLRLEAQAESVTLESPGAGREHLKPFHVKTFGSTAFAVGPADSAWEGLVEDAPAASEPADAEDREPEAPAPEPGKAPAAPAEKEEKDGENRRGCFGCLLALIALLAVLAFVYWHWRSRNAGKGEGDGAGVEEAAAEDSSPSGRGLMEKYGLTETNINGKAVLTGNFKTRAERLAAAGELYAARLGKELDLSDDESFKTAAEDLLHMLTGGDLTVVAATNRVLEIKGVTPDRATFERTLRALDADVPRLDRLVYGAVRIGNAPHTAASAGAKDSAKATFGAKKPAPAPAARKDPDFPVCGILSSPVPCLVLNDGERVMEGARIGGFTIERITADAVIVTNGTERIVWKP
ncbi:MAG: hypothetical protein K6F50_10155 [Kiritimatiellae bacterium]|nr:hypothetical protein [Kiritimatiellia bacterium]